MPVAADGHHHLRGRWVAVALAAGVVIDHDLCVAHRGQVGEEPAHAGVDMVVPAGHLLQLRVVREVELLELVLLGVEEFELRVLREVELGELVLCAAYDGGLGEVFDALERGDAEVGDVDVGGGLQLAIAERAVAVGVELVHVVAELLVGEVITVDDDFCGPQFGERAPVGAVHLPVLLVPCRDVGVGAHGVALGAVSVSDDQLTCGGCFRQDIQCRQLVVVAVELCQ